MRYTEAHRRLREIHWFDHADSYLAVVRNAVQEDPHDKELRELMTAALPGFSKTGGAGRE